ncbi:hypothetical protein LUCX_302 [Xanthomonas phage vB_XciM_LucasX]|nr:hypothetical protein LUCX_302 [Xanthomonas phage vB_XciM_LucasX]
MATVPRVITRTINGSRILAAMQQGKAYVAVPNTTLNEALGINAALQPENSAQPIVAYYGIGNNGHVFRTAGDGMQYPQARKHSPDDFGLYNQIPFLLRDPDDDITAAERANYGLRKIITVNNVNYIAYYLKRLIISADPVKMLQITVQDGVSTSVEFIPTQANLNPTPTDPAATGAVSTDGTYLVTSAIATIEFSENDVTELMEVARIMYGTVERALISELAIVAGADRIVSITDPGQSPFNMREVVAAQIVTHITGLWPVAYYANGFTYALDIGANEPKTGITTGT